MELLKTVGEKSYAESFDPTSQNVVPGTRAIRKRWTRNECEFLVQNELLVGRYELIDGEIPLKSDYRERKGEAQPTMSQKRRHAIAIVLLIQWLISVFGGDRVQCQLPIDVASEDNDTNEPEPDAAVFVQPITTYVERHPGPVDLLLVVEVSDTTLRFDLRTKALPYARAGIVEYWVLDVTGRRLYVHRQPTATGYGEVLEYAEDETLSPLARLEASVRAADLLPLLEA